MSCTKLAEWSAGFGPAIYEIRYGVIFVVGKLFKGIPIPLIKKIGHGDAVVEIQSTLLFDAVESLEKRHGYRRDQK